MEEQQGGWWLEFSEPAVESKMRSERYPGPYPCIALWENERPLDSNNLIYIFLKEPSWQLGTNYAPKGQSGRKDTRRKLLQKSRQKLF